MLLSSRNVLRLFMALIILTSVLVRPPGTMLVTHGDTLTYVLCTGGELETVQIALDGDKSEARDLSCDFFAAQVANLTTEAPDVLEYAATLSAQVASNEAAVVLPRRLWHPNSARAPPL